MQKEIAQFTVLTEAEKPIVDKELDDSGVIEAL